MLTDAILDVKLKRIIEDGAYDTNQNFKYLSDMNIEAAIKVRKNSSYGRSIGRLLSRQIKPYRLGQTKVVC